MARKSTPITFGVGDWTLYAKRQHAGAMYQRGANFIAASILLGQHGGHRYVVLHLLCQGIETMLKGLVLLADFDTHKPRLKPKYGHDLMKLVQATEEQFQLNPMRRLLEDEVRALNQLYSKHLLRYASWGDLLVDPDRTESDRILRRLAAVTRIASREMQRAGSPNTVVP